MELNRILFSSYEGYNTENKHYECKRDAGLYANLIWVIRKIALLELNGYKVNSVESILEQYNNAKSFELFFEKKDIDIDFSNISNDEKNFFENYMTSNSFGLGVTDMKGLNFNITNQIVNKFFTPNKSLIEFYNNLLESNDIQIDKTIFVWARGTDKSAESKLPTASTYANLINSLDLDGKDILIQTDDYRLIDNFRYTGLNYKTISQIPMSKSLEGFHNELKHFTEDRFYKTYNITKNDYLLQMYCLSLIGRDAHKTILYAGNPSTYIPILKGSFDNCYLFKDDNKLF